MEWYVIHTHVYKEGVVEKNLIRQKFITYLPKYKKVIRHARKVSNVFSPLFPRYLFVQMDLFKQRWASINSTFGVDVVITMGNKPVKISNKIINEIKSYDNTKGITDITPCLSMVKGDQVDILEGVFSGRKAIFDGLTDANRIKVLFNLLGKEVTLSMAPIGVARS